MLPGYSQLLAEPGSRIANGINIFGYGIRHFQL